MAEVSVRFKVNVDSTELAKLTNLSAVLQRASASVGGSTGIASVVATAGSMASNSSGPLSRMRFDVDALERSFNRLGLAATVVGAVSFRQLTSATGSLLSVFKELGKEFVNINEQFGNLEITLGSTIKSFTAAKDISKELMLYTARSPLPFQTLATTMQSFASMPATSSKLAQQVMQGTLGDKNGFFKRSLGLVESMNVFRPDQDANSALFAIREALGGQTRSLIRRFDVQSRLLTSYGGGKSAERLKNDPDAMFEALYRMFTSMISPQAVAAFARQPSKLAANFKEQFTEIPLRRLGVSDESGISPYQRMLTFAQESYDSMMKVMGDEGIFVKELLPKLKSSLNSAMDRIGAGVSDAVERLLKAFGYSSGGNRLERFVTMVTDLISNIADKTASIVEKAAQGDFITKAAKLAMEVIDFVSILAKSIASVASFLGPTGTVIAAVASPILLANAGTTIRFFFKTLPGLIKDVGDSIVSSATEAGKVSGVSGRYSMFAKTSSRITTGVPGEYIGNGRFGFGSVGYDMSPAKLADYRSTYHSRLAGGGDFEKYAQIGGTAREYFDAARRYARNVPGGTKNDYYNPIMEKEARRDYLFAKNNPHLTDVLVRRGLVGDDFVGLAGAGNNASRYSKYLAGGLHRNLVAPTLGAMGSLAMGTVAGAAVGGAIYGATELYQALTANTRATERNTEYLNLGRTDFRDKISSSADAEVAAFIAGKSKQDFSNELASGSSLGQNTGRFIQALRNTELSEMSSELSAVSKGTVLDKLFSGFSALGNPYGQTSLMGYDASMESRTLRNVAARFPQAGELFSAIEKNSNYSDLLDPESLSLVKEGFNKSYQEGSALLLKKLADRFGDSRSLIAALDKASLGEAKSLLSSRLDSSQDTRLLRAILGGDFSARSPEAVRGFIEGNTGFERTRLKLQTTDELRRSPAIGNAQELLDTALSASDITYNLRQETGNIFDMANKAVKTVEVLLADLPKTLADAEKYVADQIKIVQASISSGGLSKEQMDTAFDMMHRLMELANGGLKGSAADIRTQAEASRQTNMDLPFDFMGSNLAVSMNRLATTTNVASLTEEEINDFVAMVKGFRSAAKDKGWELNYGVSEAPGEASFGNPFTTDPVLLSQRKNAAFTDALAYGKSTLATFGMMASPETSTAIDKYVNHLDSKVFAELQRRLGTSQSSLESDVAVGAERGRGFYSSAGLANVEWAQNIYDKVGYVDISDTSTRYMEENFGVSRQNARGGAVAEIQKQKSLYEQMLASGRLSEAQSVAYNERILALIQEQYDIQQNMRPESFFDGFSEGLSTAREDLMNFAQIGKDVGSIIKNSLGDAFANIVTGTETVADAFRNMAVNILKAIAQILAQQAAAQLLNMVVSSYMGSFGTTTTPYKWGSGIKTMASGGIITGGSGVRDDVPILGMGGEVIINKQAAQEFGYDNLMKINRREVPHFSSGGIIGGAGFSSRSSSAPSTVNVNLYIDKDSKVAKVASDPQLDPKLLRELGEKFEAIVDEKLAQQHRFGSTLRNRT